jgi:hypothetical protein
LGKIQESLVTVSSYREISILASAANTMLKLIQLFSLWRLAITESVKKINPMNKSRNKGLFENFLNSPYNRDSVNTDKKSFSFPLKKEEV